MGIQLKSELIRDAKKRIKYRRFRKGGYDHYKISVWVVAPPSLMDKMDYVTYELHPSFRNRVRTSQSRSSKFGITFWAWGMFDIDVEVVLRDGKTKTFTHSLEWTLPDDDGTNYVDVTS